MKLGLVLCFIIMLVIPINYVVAQNPCYGCNQPALNSTDLEAKRQRIALVQINPLEEQHIQDLQIICLLIALIVGLGSGVITLTVILYKNRKWKIKTTSDT